MKTYHLFTDDIDQYLYNIDEAIQKAETLKLEGTPNIRVYSEDDLSDSEDLTDCEDLELIYSVGSFPN